MEHNGTMRFFSKLAMEGNPNQGAPVFEEVDYECEIDDCRKYSSVKDEVMHKISHRLHRITKMNPIPR